MKFLIIIIIIAIIAIVGIVIYKSGQEELKVEEPVPLEEDSLTEPEKETSMPEQSLQGKKIAIIIASNFRDEEYFVPKEALEAAGAKITTVSEAAGQVIGADGGEAQADLAVGETSPENFDAVLFIGGPGMAKRLDNETFQKLAKETVQADKVLGAICIAPALLAKAGVLEGKNATVWTNSMDKSAAKTLEENGAIYQDEAVVTDGNIVTANGPAAAENFAQSLINLLK